MTFTPHPNSMAALRRHWTGLQHRPRCERCRDVAVKGTTVCRKHGGAVALWRQGRVSAERRLNAAIRAASLPPALSMRPEWTAIRRRPVSWAPIAWAMLEGWRTMEATGDADRWRAALAMAKEAGALDT